MRFIFRVLSAFLSLFFLVTCNMVISYLLPYPFSSINIIFFFLIILMMAKDSGSVVWICFFSYFFIEIYSSSPFGLLLFSGTVSILIIFWLYKNIFTNRSWYSATALCILALSLYRFLYIIILSILQIFKITNLKLESSTFINFGWEILFTAFLTGFIYFTLSNFSRSFKASPIEHGLFKV